MASRRVKLLQELAAALHRADAEVSRPASITAPPAKESMKPMNGDMCPTCGRPPLRQFEYEVVEWTEDGDMKKVIKREVPVT